MLLRTWCTTFIISIVVDVASAVNCTNQSYCYVSPENGSFAEQVIEIAEHHHNRSFTVLVLPGDYVSTNGSNLLFINFQIVTFRKYETEYYTGDAEIQCPEVAQYDL